MRMLHGAGKLLLLSVVLPALLTAASSRKDFDESKRVFQNDNVTDNGEKLEDAMQDRDAQYGREETDGNITKIVMNVRVEQKLINTTQQNALVIWDPPSDSAWERYDVSILVKKRDEAPDQNRDCMQNASKLHECVMTALAFNANYTVTVTGIGNRTKSELSGIVTFSTLSEGQTCLQYTDYNLTTCPPETPLGVSTREIQIGERHMNGTLHNIVATWAPSKHPPQMYIVRFRTWVNDTLTGEVKQNVSGNVTSVTFSSVIVGHTYDVGVKAYSEGGLSPWASSSKFFEPEKLQPSKVLTASPVVSDDFYKIVVGIMMTILTLFLLVTGVGLFVYHRYRKKKRYEERCRYFQNLDQKPPVVSTSVGSKVVVTAVDDKWEIPFDRLLQGDILGEGAFGVVRKGLLEGRTGDKQPLLEVAVKMVRDDPSLDELRQFLQEIEMMKSVGQHQNIVSIIGCCTHGPKVMLVTEFCALGDLQRYLKKEWDRLCNSKQERREVPNADKTFEKVKYAQLALSTKGSGYEFPENIAGTPTSANKPTLFVNRTYDLENARERRWENDVRLTTNDLLSFARQITLGMEFLAGNRVVHRDLAARNVLVCADQTVKISDFGLSRDIYEQNFYRKTCTGKLPIKWMAIESLLHQVYTTQSDVWSFGVLLWEIVTLGGNPYPSTQTNGVFKLLRAGYRMEQPTNCSKELYNIMLNCWELNPRDRPTFSQLRVHLDGLLESSISDQYLNLDLLVTNKSPQTSTSTVDHQSSSASARSRTQIRSGDSTAPVWDVQSGSDDDPPEYRFPMR